jgi:hypothetical protein
MTNRRNVRKGRDMAHRRLRSAARPEPRETAPRLPPDGATSFPVKRVDPDTKRLIDEALAARGRT